MNDYTRTPNFQLYKPEANADYDLWGDHLNANADIIDGLMQTSQATLGDTPPDDPRPGQFWFDTVNAQLYVWDVDPTSSQWTIATAQNSVAVVSDLAPPNPTPGQFWFDSVNPQLYVWLVDPTGPGQWVVAVSAAQGPPGPPGGLGEAPNDGFAYGRLSAAWSKVLPLTAGGTNPLTGNLTIATPGNTLTFSAAVGTAQNINFNAGGLFNWALVRDNTAFGSPSNNTGAKFGLAAYADAGTPFIGYLWQGTRGSGPTGQGGPWFNIFHPYAMATPRATTPGGVVGNDASFLTGDVQPTTTLGANPLATTSGSPVVTVTWTGCGLGTGAINGTSEAWVFIAGATAIGGITPSGWLKATRTGNDTFTVNWTANATSTVAAGGGSAVTVQPSFTTIQHKDFTVSTSSATGFSIQYSRLYAANPQFLVPVGGSSTPQFQQEWRVVSGPVDASPANTNFWGICATELDLINRGPDVGYFPNLYGAPNLSVGFWCGAAPGPILAGTGGGTAANWNTIYSVYSHPGVVGCYTGYSIQHNALVGAAHDPTGHGGVGFVPFGAYATIQAGRLATTSGTSTVTFTIPGGGYGLAAQVNGNSVYIPIVTTLNGVTVGGGSYVMSGVTATTFNVTGTGTASATGPGGATQWLAFADLVPYAPIEFQGSFKHGISTVNFRSEDGSIIRTQPGNGIIWDDGVGTASITGVAVSLGVIGVQLTGRVGFNGTAPVVKPTVTGAKGSNAALASLLTALAAYGLVTDSTTA